MGCATGMHTPTDPLFPSVLPLGTAWPPVVPTCEGFQVGAEGGHGLGWAGLACKSGEDTFFPTLMGVLAGGLLGSGRGGGGGGERTGCGWGLSQAVLGDGRRRGFSIRSNDAHLIAGGTVLNRVPRAGGLEQR